MEIVTHLIISYNELNHLVEVKRNGITIAGYYYDHVGLRYKKVDYLEKKTTIYVYGRGIEPIKILLVQ